MSREWREKIRERKVGRGERERRVERGERNVGSRERIVERRGKWKNT